MCVLLQPVSEFSAESKDTEVKFESKVQETVENILPSADLQIATATLKTTALVN